MTCLHRKFMFLLLTAVALFVTLIALVIISVKKWNSAQPIVKTNLGMIRGLRATDGDYSMYMGVPYAKVDKENPFGRALPFGKFEGVFDANDDTAACPQKDDYNHTLRGSLDCLRMNIYVPSIASVRNRLPVLVYLQGGHNIRGFNRRIVYGPTFLVKQNIILILMNYRLGPYGFMCLDTPGVAGNQGLKDQLQALKWINENIDAFGGDPQRVTFAGSSVGGLHVMLHFMRTSKPLFQQVILQGASKAYPLLMTDPDVTVPLKIAQDLGLHTKHTSEALKFLATEDPLAVVNSSLNLNIEYKVCVENEFDNVENFITTHISNIKDIPSLRNMPVLVAQSNSEILYLYSNLDFDGDNKNIFETVLNSLFEFDEARLKRMVEHVKHFYLGDQEVSNKLKGKIIDFGSDVVHNYPTILNNRKFLDNNVKKLYHFIFSFVGERNFLRLIYHVNDSYTGATHNNDQGYLYDAESIMDKHSPNDDLMIDRVTTIWANFVKYGDPAPKKTKLLPLKWKPVTKDSQFYYNIDTNVTTSVQPFQQRMAFWDLFYKLNGKYERKPTRH